MHPIRKQRLQIVVLILFASSLAAALIIYVLGENSNYFFSPSQVLRGEAPENVTIKVGGLVVEGSIERSPDSLDVSFVVTDRMSTIKVTYNGILPDLFAENEAAVATGKLDSSNILHASQVLAKHDENYTPPNVADALNQAYELKQQSTYSSEEAEK